MDKDQARKIRMSALARWRSERGDYLQILQEEGRKIMGVAFDLQRLGFLFGTEPPKSHPGARLRAGPKSFTVRERSEIMRRAHQALFANGTLPITTGNKYNMLFDGAEVPGDAEGTYMRYVAALLSYRGSKKRKELPQSTLFQERKRSPDPRASSSPRLQEASHKGTSPKKRKSKRGRSIRTLSGGLPGLGRRK